MNKLKYSLLLLLFCALGKAQTDTTRVIPAKPDSVAQKDVEPTPAPTNTVQKELDPTPAPTPTVTPQQPNRKRPKGYNDYVKHGKLPSDRPPFTDNLYYGCNVQLGFYTYSGYNVLYYDLSPHVGYKFNEFLSAGVQVIYNNQSYSLGTQRINYNIFGVGGFGRLLIVNRFFLQVEFDMLSVPANFRGGTIVSRNLTDEKMAGFGYKSPLGDKLAYFFVLLYDFQPGQYSPYLGNPLIYRAGLSWNF